ncbi:hypothetical protein DCC85_18470 [Paenibacillus sp. CAA11]|uniref:DUF4097 family beta strand repeat-containing protein n=1 Tax=Paenibacillus sp. CAA11 TaxID=1532905 RepID=UPI000D37B5BD|nr:DUF4097 family beta strand repeat-containing protein [Paenibacillus sp. CAA11]AWB45957.1 hypothetical protein DCC85_18470 [Paenibacillus sp. CAA11]
MAKEQVSSSDENGTPRPNGAQARKGYRPRRRKRKFVSVLLTALFPGLGHVYLKLFSKGIALIYLIAIDLAALIYFSSVRIQINVPLLIIMGLLVPMIYFYSIYDVLQSTDSMNSRSRNPVKAGPGRELLRGTAIGAMMVAGGLIVWVLRIKPKWLEVLIQEWAGYICAGILAAVGLSLFMQEIKYRAARTGRFTASLLLLGVSVLLLLEELTQGDFLLLLINWWPVLLVLLGVEYIAVLIWKRRKAAPGHGRRFRLDIKGILGSVVAAACVFAVTQQDHYLHLWNKVSLDLTAAGTEFSEQKGYSFLKEPLTIPVNSDMKGVRIENINGTITVSREPVFEVQVEAKVYVDEVQREEAKAIADAAEINISEGDKLSIVVNDRGYGQSGKRHPRVNLHVILPFNRDLTLDATTTNGSLLVKSISSRKIKLQTGNGAVELSDIYGDGDISLKTLNGDVALTNVFGDVNADTQGGKMTAENVQGSAKLSTLVGDLNLKDNKGNIDVSTKNGNIRVEGADQGLNAESLNGKISIRSSSIGGDWSVYSAVGEVNITLPYFGSYHLEASSGYGEIYSNLPFEKDNKRIEGELGEGQYQIKLEGNSNLLVNRENLITPMMGE